MLQILEKAASSVDFLDKADKQVAGAIVAAYLKGLSFSHAVSLLCSSLAFVGSLVLREHKLA